MDRITVACSAFAALAWLLPVSNLRPWTLNHQKNPLCSWGQAPNPPGLTALEYLLRIRVVLYKRIGMVVKI